MDFPEWKMWRGGKDKFNKTEMQDIKAAFTEHMLLIQRDDTAICTSCGPTIAPKSFFTHKGRHICPSCGKGVTAIHTWRKKLYMKHYALVFVHRKTPDKKACSLAPSP